MLPQCDAATLLIHVAYPISISQELFVCRKCSLNQASQRQQQDATGKAG